MPMEHFSFSFILTYTKITKTENVLVYIYKTLYTAETQQNY